MIHFLNVKIILYTFRNGIYISVSILIFPCFISLVLIEKILRTNSDVGKFYIIIKAKDDEAAKERLINEV